MYTSYNIYIHVKMCLSSTSQNVLRLFWIATLLLGTRTLAELHCIDPGTPDNGFIRVEQYPFSVGSKAFFACSSGYILYGADTLVCQLSTDGYGAQWSASRPNCVHALSSDTLLPSTETLQSHSVVKRGTGCTDCGAPRNGFRTFQTDTSTIVVTFGCNRGFGLDGPKRLQCNSQGEWDGDWPTCIPVPERATCGDPGTIFSPLGSRYVEGTEEGDTVTYWCVGGFVLMGGDEVRTCLPTGEWSGTLPFCESVNCGDPGEPANGRSLDFNHMFGYSVHYTCDAGHVLEGASEITCLQSATWTSGPPNCRAVRCRDLPRPPHGNVDHSRPAMYQTEASYQCDTRYGLVGRDTRVCMGNGQWSGVAPTCELGRCDEVRDPQNGRVLYSSHDIGEIASYECDHGYRLTGQPKRQCQDSGRWTDTAPTCEPGVCSDIALTNNVIVSLTNYNFVFSIATYSCPGYFFLIGNVYRECQPSGVWNGSLPGCFPIICPQLYTPVNGYLSLSDRLCYLSEAIYGCDGDYEVYGGDMIRTCQQNKKWTGTEPSCVPIIDPVVCEALPPIANGRVTELDSSLGVGSIATYTCDNGYSPTGGDTQRVCTENGVWTGQEPSCARVVCEELTNPVSGTVIHANNSVGSIAEYSCIRGYNLSGDSTRTCMDTGMWSGNEPICELVDCGFLVAPSNGIVNFGMTTFGSMATYECNPSYQLVGMELRLCGEDGVWSGDPPTCEVVDCGFLVAPSNGIVNFNTTTLGSMATYECNPSYQLVGMELRLCGGDGVWSGDPPTCEVVDCGFLVAPSNGIVNFNTTTLGSMATYECNPSYQLVGMELRLCGGDGVWSGDPPTCEAVDCGNLMSLENGNVLVGMTTPGAVAVYTCDTSYELVGNPFRQCHENGTWSGEAPTCEAIECSELMDPINGSVMVTTRTVGAMATYMCNTSFTLVGNESRLCLEIGIWSGEAPTCEVISCPILDDPMFGSVSYESEEREVGSIASYSCQDHYTLIGATNVTCLETSLWSEGVPTCELISCPILDDPMFGSVSYESEEREVGSIASYSCQDHYTLIGATNVTCLETSLWSEDAPTCELISCPILDDPMFGSVSYESEEREVGSIASYSCQDHYTLIGATNVTCLETSLWSEDAPTCEFISCPILDDPMFGSVSYESEEREVGSIASYSCQDRYTLIGATNVTCLETSLWSEDVPTCELLECPGLADPLNGMVSLPDTVPGSTAQYLCNAGFMLVGTSSRECRLVGERGVQWEGVAPTCDRIMCPLLEDPANGTVNTPPPYFVNQTVLYLCNNGFEPSNGFIRRVCMADGTWSGNAPMCILSHVACPANLPNPEFGNVQIQGDGRLGSMAVYECNLGYMAVGEANRLCELDGLVGEWSGEEPTCEIVMCPLLEQPVDGFVRIIALVVNETALYICNSGFVRVGPVRRQCLPTGEWDGTDAVCNPQPTTVSCGRLVDPLQGTVSLTTTVPGSVAAYSCIQGYVLVDGTRERRCQTNGTWDGTEPSCDVVDCGPLSDPPNGIVSVSLNTTLGTTATYECNLGYELVGLASDTRFCTVNGVWSETDPSCERVNCGSLNPPVNGVIDQSEGTLFMDVTFYSCLTGYVLSPPEAASRVCTAIGEWSDRNPTCELRASTVDCGDLPFPENGQVILLNTSTGEQSLAEYSCNEGYMIEGETVRQCQETGIWGGTAPTCVVRQCPPLQGPDNGSVFIAGTTVNSSVTYLCDSGFQLVGLIRRLCQSDGEWTGEDPRCLRPENVMCHALLPPTNGSSDMLPGEQTVGTTVIFDCEEGFSLEGSRRRTCQTNGAWNGIEVTCERNQCPDPGTPADGRRFVEGDFQVGSSIVFQCFDGFELDGMVALTCQEDGTWNHPTPTCTLPTTSGSRRRRGSCSNSDEVEILPGLGERCVCVSSHLESCCRYRQEWSQLSPEQQSRYITAVKTASSDPQYRSIYNHIMQLYLEAFESVVLNDDADTSLFFPWHRYYLHLYEDLLRVIDRSVTIPYWDWTMNPGKPYESQVFNPDLGFGNSIDNVTLCVNSGPFREDEFLITPQAGVNRCIRRTYGDFPFFNRQLLRSILSLPATSFDQFHSTVQLFFHFPIRCFVGGTMCTNFASQDPLYLLLLAQLDRILDEWQRSDEDRATVRYADDSSSITHTLEPTDELKVSDYSSNKKLPYGAAVCYSEVPPLQPVTLNDPE